jgi:C-terminal processing protease CtpA/Prc
VSPESPAARCGLVVGDRIATIDGLPAELVGETMREVLVQTRDALRLGVVRPEGVREVVVEVVTLVE